MGKVSQTRGAVGEKIARLMLQTMGVEMIEKISTPYVVTHRGKNGWIKIAHSEKVSGDIRGIIPGSGRRVLVEVKARENNLRKSDFTGKDRDYHQLRKLQENHALGAISLIVWIHPYDNLILRWPFDGKWNPESRTRASLTFENARDLYQWDGIS